MIDDGWMLVLGTLLFLAGLLNGVAMPLLRNKRMGLSAHLVGVQHGMVLWIIGLILPRITTGEDAGGTLDVVMTWSLVLGLWGLWLAMLLAAIWGASRALPMAGAGFSATPAREATVGGLVYGPAALIIVGAALLLWRLLPTL